MTNRTWRIHHERTRDGSIRIVDQNNTTVALVPVGEGRNAMFDAMDVVAAHARIHPAVALLRRVRGTPGQEYDLSKAEAVLDDVDAFLATIETAEVP